LPFQPLRLGSSFGGNLCWLSKCLLKSQSLFFIGIYEYPNLWDGTFGVNLYWQEICYLSNNLHREGILRNSGNYHGMSHKCEFYSLPNCMHSYCTNCERATICCFP